MSDTEGGPQPDSQQSSTPDSNPEGSAPRDTALGENQDRPQKGRPDAAARTALIVIAFAVLVGGMALDGVAGIALIVLAIAMFLVSIVVGIASK